MRLTDPRKILFLAFLAICALSSKKITIYNEEIIVALCFTGFILLTRRSFGNTLRDTLNERIQAIKQQLQEFPNPNEVIPLQSNEQEKALRTGLQVCATLVQSLPLARCAPKCEKTVQALLARNLNLKLATLDNAVSSRRNGFQDQLVTQFETLVAHQFTHASISKADRVEFIRDSLAVLRKARTSA